MERIETIFLAVIFVVSISLHEYAHAWTSRKLGDPTPEYQWRLTPNPLVHIDPIGFILIFLIHFGWGRPVEVNPAYYKHPLRDELLVALAWPATNIILAIGGTIILMLYVLLAGTNVLFDKTDIIVQFWMLFGLINSALAIFNLIPLPPLDGRRIIKFLFPSFGYRIERYGRYISLVVILLILAPGTGTAISRFVSTLSHVVYGSIYFVISSVFL